MVTHVLSGNDLADMQLIRNYNKGFRILLSAIDILSRYAWAVSLKNKKGNSITNAFQKKAKWASVDIITRQWYRISFNA